MKDKELWLYKSHILALLVFIGVSTAACLYYHWFTEAKGILSAWLWCISLSVCWTLVSFLISYFRFKKTKG